VSYSLDFKADNVSIFKRFSFIRATSRWAEEIGPVLEAAIRAEAPVGKKNGGRLRESIKFRKRAGISGVALEFGSDVPYASFVEDGTPPHLILPRRASMLRFESRSGETVYSPYVHHPGTKPNPFARRAVERMSPFIMESFKANVEAEFL
jgi:HK97 gp10 family phage protein